MRLMQAVMLFALALPAQERAVTLDAAKTEVNYVLNSALHTVHGHFTLKRGSLRFDMAGGKASGEFVVDATSGDSGSGARDGRMHKNILESAKYPEITLTATRLDGKVAEAGASNVTLHGSFQIHGQAHDVTLPAKVEINGDHVTFQTSLIVPYVAWGMKSPSTFLLRVDDKVRIEIKGTGKLTPVN